MDPHSFSSTAPTSSIWSLLIPVEQENMKEHMYRECESTVRDRETEHGWAKTREPSSWFNVVWENRQVYISACLLLLISRQTWQEGNKTKKKKKRACIDVQRSFRFYNVAAHRSRTKAWQFALWVITEHHEPLQTGLRLSHWQGVASCTIIFITVDYYPPTFLRFRCVGLSAAIVQSSFINAFVKLSTPRDQIWLFKNKQKTQKPLNPDLFPELLCTLFKWFILINFPLTEQIQVEIIYRLNHVAYTELTKYRLKTFNTTRARH